MISIEGGTTRISEGIYSYTYATLAGRYTTYFTASQVPKIGDSIDGGVLVPLVGYKVNHDVSRWIAQEYDVYPKKRAM